MASSVNYNVPIIHNGESQPPPPPSTPNPVIIYTPPITPVSFKTRIINWIGHPFNSTILCCIPYIIGIISFVASCILAGYTLPIPCAVLLLISLANFIVIGPLNALAICIAQTAYRENLKCAHENQEIIDNLTPEQKEQRQVYDAGLYLYLDKCIQMKSYFNLPIDSDGMVNQKGFRSHDFQTELTPFFAALKCAFDNHFADLPALSSSKQQTARTILNRFNEILSNTKQYCEAENAWKYRLLELLSSVNLNYHGPLPVLFLINKSHPQGIYGHRLCMEVQKSSNGLWTVTLFNTGLGVNAHPKRELVNARTKFQTFYSFKNVDLKRLNQIPRIPYPNDTTKNFMLNYYNYFNSVMHALGGEYIPPSLNVEDYEQIQSDGTCVGQSLMAYFRYFVMREAGGSKQNQLGMYKHLKAHFIDALVEILGPQATEPYKQGALQKQGKQQLQKELYIWSKDVYKYKNALQALHDALLNSTKKLHFTRPTTQEERFSHIRKLAHAASYLPTNRLESLIAQFEKIGGCKSLIKEIYRRRETREEEKLFVDSQLTKLRNEDQTLRLNCAVPHIWQDYPHCRTWRLSLLQLTNSSKVDFW